MSFYAVMATFSAKMSVLFCQISPFFAPKTFGTQFVIYRVTESFSEDGPENL